ncbi:MerR family transcriptional regulator [Nocardiopsis changdeensis]|uniref:MerR family transcriptional regulator n=1 Tax=Nocardiopsis changdeensis TaxID=2831969 RepID=A0ABX8BP82_9ACTN|nr:MULTISPECIES: MerR family transcriptional regulator [Nocardiopsis]QUX24050.1 MerR family transcriptional regulator [Nocardiopsis changdeensis]QYX34446.1 MerR family transcriptional regulator [Nocardiopsis sp. MT53]
MLIGELSERTGVSRRLLRYYEEQGLLDSARAANGYRTYDPDAVRTVRAVRALLAMGLSTETIASVLPCVRDPEADPVELELCPDLVATIRAEVAALDARIEELSGRRGALSAQLAGC